MAEKARVKERGRATAIVHGGSQAAVHLELDGHRTVAVKRVATTTDSGDLSVTLVREVDCLRRIKGHPHVVTLRSVRLDADAKSACLLMDCCPMTLRMLLHTEDVAAGGRARELMRQLLSGLAHCHTLSVIHRDIKPENILIDQSGNLRIADFGLARRMFVLADSAHPPGRPYTPGMVTLWYRSRELLRGEAYGADVDVWSAGCVYFEMLTGRPLFCAHTELGVLGEIRATLECGVAWEKCTEHLTATERGVVTDSLVSPAHDRVSAAALLARMTSPVL